MRPKPEDIKRRDGMAPLARVLDNVVLADWDGDLWDQCWGWTGRLGANGTPITDILKGGTNHTTMTTRKYLYRQLYPKLPQDVFLRRQCLNDASPQCINPTHHTHAKKTKNDRIKNANKVPIEYPKYTQRKKLFDHVWSLLAEERERKAKIREETRAKRRKPPVGFREVPEGEAEPRRAASP